MAGTGGNLGDGKPMGNQWETDGKQELESIWNHGFNWKSWWYWMILNDIDASERFTPHIGIYGPKTRRVVAVGTSTAKTLACVKSLRHKNMNFQSSRGPKSRFHTFIIIQISSGWWFEPLWKILVNWDDEIPNIWENKKWQPNHQPVDDLGIFGPNLEIPPVPPSWPSHFGPPPGANLTSYQTPIHTHEIHIRHLWYSLSAI